MPVETVTYIDDLVVTNPLGSDDLATADDHLRLIKVGIKNTWPNVAGAVQATHTELDYTNVATAGTAEASKAVVLDANKRVSTIDRITANDLFIQNSIATPDVTAGSGAAYTVAAFPIASYTTNEVYMVRAHADNTSTAPTIDLNSLGTKTIKLADGSALKLGSIQTNMLMILMYNGTDMLLQNPHVLQGKFASDSNGMVLSGTAFNLTLNVTAGDLTWESVGPTGSGATNIWTALDNVPSDADFIEIKVSGVFRGSSDQVVYCCARINGSSTNYSVQSAGIIWEGYPPNGVKIGHFETHKVRADSNGIFEVKWHYGGSAPTSSAIWLHLVGYGYNDA